MASRMLLGRNICRYVSSRPLSANSSASSFPSDRIPPGARRYSSRNDPSSVNPYDNIGFWGFTLWWLYQVVQVDLTEDHRCCKELVRDTRKTREKIAQLKAELEEQREKCEALKKLAVAENLDLASLELFNH